MWVLTGDKVDTAVNIGYACALLTTRMDVMYITSDANGKMLEVDPKTNEASKSASKSASSTSSSLTIEKVTLRLTQVLASIQLEEQINSSSTGGGDGRALVVDTYVLSLIEKGKLENLFLQIAEYCASVVCARVSPSQKSTGTFPIPHKQHKDETP